MSLKERITEDMKAAMRAGEKERLGCIRMIRPPSSSAKSTSASRSTTRRCSSVLEKMIKQRKESLVQFQAGGRADLVAKETAEIALLTGLPARSSSPTPSSTP